ncbi:unnamed protein product [Pseudo-nitzschia multistriata]|uniref:Uncharacterized protein n=1 Tax=Pseudo-nitzschia multistriata TaxID=183589 RepID=A0A448Z2Z7_9STRA|nr:unnamed protein product [Pseudo-nitzschia multistriata]
MPRLDAPAFFIARDRSRKNPMKGARPVPAPIMIRGLLIDRGARKGLLTTLALIICPGSRPARSCEHTPSTRTPLEVSNLTTPTVMETLFGEVRAEEEIEYWRGPRRGMMTRTSARPRRGFFLVSKGLQKRSLNFSRKCTMVG